MSEQTNKTENENNTQENTNGHNSNNGLKRSREHEHLNARFLVYSRDAGAIIGKRGSNIQLLRQKHKIVIQIPDCDGPERVLSLQGDYELCMSAIVDMLPILKDSQRMQNDQSEIRLLVHKNQAGALIGKSGERLRELRTRYNVGMKIFGVCLPLSTERVAALRGRIDDVESCLREVFTILEEAPVRTQMSLYDPINFDVSLSAEYGGFSDGNFAGLMNQSGGGGNPMNGPPLPHASLHPPPPPPPPSYHGPHDHGNFNGPSYGNHMDYPSGPMDNYNHLPPSLGVGPNPNYGPPQIQMTQVTIPNHFSSCIIGPRGTKIAHIRRTSGTVIRIDDPAPGSDDRIISIEGTPQQISQAQYLLQMAVKESGLWNGN
ncbi:unnamed protein product [Adineta ricciae]|nr:unnamed protein product [Adineta ricciae]